MKQTIKDFKDITGKKIKIGDILDDGRGGTVKVVETEDYETGFGFDLEDKDGDRVWNPYFAVERMRILTN